MQGFQIIHSLGGGTGSGMAVCCLEPLGVVQLQSFQLVPRRCSSWMDVLRFHVYTYGVTRLFP